jgi:NCAIR mutase (PurE)-related protein
MHVHDDRRLDRIGMPEAVLCSAKSDSQLRVIVDELASTGHPTLLTRLPAERLGCLSPEVVEQIDHDPISETGILGGMQSSRPGKVAIAAAGTSDQRVATEAARTLEFSGVDAEVFVDIGVAGLWRLEARLPELRAADIVIVVAGMDAALVSVMGGLVGAPIIGVPTSVGYGVAEGGSTALNSALASCAQGVAVVNIDNGFGAACAAVRMLSLLGTDRSHS